MDQQRLLALMRPESGLRRRVDCHLSSDDWLSPKARAGPEESRTNRFIRQSIALPSRIGIGKLVDDGLMTSWKQHKKDDPRLQMTSFPVGGVSLPEQQFSLHNCFFFLLTQKQDHERVRLNFESHFACHWALGRCGWARGGAESGAGSNTVPQQSRGGRRRKNYMEKTTTTNKSRYN